MRERTVEQYLCQQVASVLLGFAYKFRSPGRNNVPDRIVVLPGGRIFFVEVKAPKKKPNPGQRREHMRLYRMGCNMLVLDTIKKVDNFIEMRRNKMLSGGEL